MTILSVSHTTTYSYAKPVAFGEHRMMFRPRDSFDQRLLSAEMNVSPAPSSVSWAYDVFGNCVTNVSIETKSTELRFETQITLDHMPHAAPDFLIETGAQTWPIDYDPEILPDLAPYMTVQNPGPELESWARKFTRSGLETQTGHLLMTMATGVKESLRYSRRNDPGTQRPDVTLAHRTGTCRDFAWLMIEACRSLGFAARFVTGYLYVPRRHAGAVRGAGATHAWVQVFLPGAGWIEFDPTNGIIGSRDLIRVGVARLPRQARPLTGSFVGKPADYLGMAVAVDVTMGDAVKVGEPLEDYAGQAG